MMKATFLCLVLLSIGYAQEPKRVLPPNYQANPPQRQAIANPAHKGGPTLKDALRKGGIIPQDLIKGMFKSMERYWFVPQYEQAKSVDLRLRVDADLPVSAVSRRSDSDETLDFDITVEGVAVPRGDYRLEVQGGLGDVEMIKNRKRNFVSSKNFKSFSDTPRRGRTANANLTNYRSYIMRAVGRLKNQILESGNYRAVYTGTGIYQGRNVHRLSVYKPPSRAKSNNRQPMPLSKMWTFWHDGGYELWLYENNYLPAVVFYTNSQDNIAAHFSIDYDRDWLPLRLNFQNNTYGAEGRGDVVFDFDSQKLLKGLSLRFDGVKGVSLRLDASLLFGGEPAPESFRVIPPFGFRKLNRDHLKLMILTQISGGLLKLKKYGINIKNFKF